MNQVWIALVFTSLFSALGALFLILSREDMERTTPYLISLSAGSILGGVFIHLIFRAAQTGFTRITGLLILSGLVLSFLLEKAVHWHCHHTGRHEEPTPYVLAAGDTVHNILDGVLIATSFLAGTSAGIASTLAVIAHKVPKEVGDFGVMVNGGFTRRKALIFNVAISLAMFIGAAAVISLTQLSETTVTILLPLVIGNFVYIGGSDLLPEIKDQENWMKHLLVFSIGVAIMWGIPLLKSLI